MSPPPPAFAARGVLVATSSRGLELDRARQIARANGSTLHVLSLDRRAGPKERAFAIADAAEDTRSSLAVIGARRHRRARRSLSERVYDVASAAVLQVRNPVTGPYERVVIATDGRASSLRAMSAAAKWVARGARNIEYLHAYASPSEPRLVAQGLGFVTVRHYRRECASEARDRMLALFERESLEPSSLRLAHGPPALVLSSVPAGALLVVHRDRGWLRHLVLGSVTRTVLAEADADVLVV